MNPSTPRRLRLGWKTILLGVVAAPFLGLTVFIAYGLSCLIPSHSTRELTHVVIRGSGGNWTWRGSGRVDSAPLILARFVSGFVETIPEEARMALRAVRSGEVAVYEREATGRPTDYRRLLADADRVMQDFGRERVIVVLEGSQLVAVYLPSRSLTARSASGTVLVLDQNYLVVASATADLAPLFTLARRKFSESHHLSGTERSSDRGQSTRKGRFRS